MRVYVDTNILIDFVCKREEFFTDAQKLFALGYTGKTELILSALSIVNTKYVARKFGSSIIDNRIKKLAEFVEIVDLRADTVITSLDSGWKDYEDATQELSAIIEKAECIVTRNKKDYEKSTLPVYTVDDFLELVL